MKKFLFIVSFSTGISNVFCMQDELPLQRSYRAAQQPYENVMDVLVSCFNPVITLHDIGGWVWNPKFSPNGKWAVLPVTDGTVKIIEVATGSVRYNLVGHKEAVNDAWFSVDGSKLVTASSDSTVKVWDLSNGKLMNTLYHGDTVWSAKFLESDDRFVVTACQDGTAKIWNTRTSKQCYIFKSPAHLPFWNVHFSGDDKSVIGILANGTTGEWDVVSGMLLTLIVGGAAERRHAHIHHDGSKIVRALPNQTVQIGEIDPLKADGVAELLASLSLHHKVTAHL